MSTSQNRPASRQRPNESPVAATVLSSMNISARCSRFHWEREKKSKNKIAAAAVQSSGLYVSVQHYTALYSSTLYSSRGYSKQNTIYMYLYQVIIECHIQFEGQNVNKCNTGRSEAKLQMKRRRQSLPLFVRSCTLSVLQLSVDRVGQVG